MQTLQQFLIISNPMSSYVHTYRTLMSSPLPSKYYRTLPITFFVPNQRFVPIMRLSEKSTETLFPIFDNHMAARKADKQRTKIWFFLNYNCSQIFSELQIQPIFFQTTIAARFFLNYKSSQFFFFWATIAANFFSELQIQPNFFSELQLQLIGLHSLISSPSLKGN